MDRSTMKQLGILIAALVVAAVLILLLINYLAPVAAADAVEQRHIHYYPRSIADAGYEVGASGIQEVRDVQMRLYDLGYDVVVDGIPCPGTDAALREFQRDRHLAVTGDLDKHTFAALWSRSQAERDAGPVVDLKCMGEECR